MIPSSVVIEGGIAWNTKIDGFDKQTVTDAVEVDGSTIVKEGGKLVAKVKGGGITELTFGMVVGALTYTPFNSAEFTKANIKSTLGISDWALASSLEWSAVNGRPTALSQFTDDVVADIIHVMYRTAVNVKNDVITVQLVLMYHLLIFLTLLVSYTA